jgi:hypothetical protein
VTSGLLKDKLVVGHGGVVGLDGEGSAGGQQAEEFGLCGVDWGVHDGGARGGHGLVQLDALAG